MRNAEQSSLGLVLPNMLLTDSQSYELLERHGVFSREACDKCGQLLGAVRYTRRGEAGAWCSRKCRDGAQIYVPGTCRACGALLAGLRRGTRYCSDLCRIREHRASKTAKNSRNQPLKTRDLQGRLEVLAIPAPSTHSEAVQR